MTKKTEQTAVDREAPDTEGLPKGVPADKAPTQAAVKSLFDKLLSGDEKVPTVTNTTTTGKRWNYVQREVADKVIVIHRFAPITTQYGDSYLADIDLDGEQTTLLVGADVLKRQLQEMADSLPMVAVISKPGKAYVFMEPTQEQLQEYYDTYLKG
jgi:hypothetical protein